MSEKNVAARVAEKGARTKADKSTIRTGSANEIRGLYKAWRAAAAQVADINAEIVSLDTDLKDAIYRETFWPRDNNLTLAALVKDARRHGFGKVVEKEWQRREELVSKIATKADERDRALLALNRRLKEECDDRAKELYRAYEQTIVTIADAVKLFCEDEAEAIEMAKLFGRATSLHRRSWSVSQWSTAESALKAVEELETPINRIAA